MLKEKLGPIVDAAGHVLEPADTWLKYLIPSTATALSAFTTSRWQAFACSISLAQR